MKQEISSFWYTPKGYKGIGLMELLSIKSFIDNDYKFILYTYNIDDKIFKKLDELFDDFELKDANEIVPFENYFSDDKGPGVASFADFFRYSMLYIKGGIWTDLDMVCLHNANLSQEYIFTSEIGDSKINITNSFLKYPKDSDFGKLLIQECKKIINNRKQIPWGVIGPLFLTNLVEKMQLVDYTWDYKKTCQISWARSRDFVKNSITIDNNQPFLHLYSEMWRANDINKNHFYQKGIYGNLLKKYKIKNLIKQLDYNYGFKDRYYLFFLIARKIKYYLRHPKKIFQGKK
ncbi:glycosyltransferase [Campylobacter lari]